jgi:tRNA threonylcarbamoyladenosine biosynthesis protein TsaE
LTYLSPDEAATDRLGRALAATLPHGAVVALDGPLGAGKTRLIQAIAEAAGVDRRSVVSPTFVLVQEYYGQTPIYHIDAYRLSGVDEFLNLGGEEYLATDGWTFIEWAERIAGCLPDELLCIRIEPLSSGERRIELSASGAPNRDALAAIALQLQPA